MGERPFEKTSRALPTATAFHERYPGPRSFTADPVDQRLFFGREKEVATLVDQVRGSKLLVLFGKSGLGKTSLLQAGLFPRLRAGDLLPLRVRVNRRDAEPLALVIEAVGQEARAQGIDFTPGDEGSLWEFFKTAVFWRGNALQTPVLVFDQFEEIFTRQDPAFRRRLAGELGDLLSGGLPEAVRKRVMAGEKLSYGEKPPTVKIIVSLREEYVGALEELFPEIPTILENRVRLTPLAREQAREAVVSPAGLEDAALASRPFRYHEKTLARLLGFLQGKTGEVEPFQLQVLCSRIERQVARAQMEDAAIEIDDSYLGTTAEMEAVLRNFYLDAVRKLTSRRARRAARKLCEEGLLSPEDHRESLVEGRILRSYKLRRPDLEALENARLLRKEPGLGGFYYELTHDSLASPVMKSRRPKLSKRILYGGVTLFLFVLGLALWNYQAARVAQDEALLAKTEEERARWVIRRQFEGKEVVQPEMVTIPAGSFQMGSSKEDPAFSNEFPRHEVVFSKPFGIGKYEVTFDEYDVFALATGRRLPDDFGWGRGSRPVVDVSWQDARHYAKWLSEQTGLRYRLPTEAEWEYAARGGTDTRYWWGNDVGRNRANCDGCGSEWDGKQTAPVGSFEANPFGVYDTVGNVWEWVQDCWHETYEGAPRDGAAWETGSCDSRVLRGGSWGSEPGFVRAATRDWFVAVVRIYSPGFRLAQDL